METSFVHKLIDAKNDEQIREVMADYIRKNFSDLLGGDVFLLNSPGGLELIAQKYGFSALAGETTSNTEEDEIRFAA